MAWYKTGTVSVTNGSATVTGSGTAWVANVRVGDGFAGPDDRLYEITGVSSNTSITISPTYDGSTTSGQAYLIWPTSSFGADIVASLNSLISTYSTIATGPGAGKFANGTAALPAVAAAADVDTGAYWDGSNGYGIATGGAVRGLFSSSGMALTGLLSGTAVTQTAIDTTTGRVTKVGDFGIGGVGPTIGNAGAVDNSIAPGIYGYSTSGGSSGGPSSASTGTLIHQRRAAGGGENQIFMADSVTTDATLNVGGIFTRSRGTGAWGSWNRSFHSGNIFRTVSQSSGVPTGGLIERSSSANGEYVRFADGTQICSRTDLATPIVGTADGNIFRSGTLTWTFPATFVAAPALSGSVDDFGGWLSLSSVSGTSASGVRMAAATDSDTPVARLIAIGRWF